VPSQQQSSRDEPVRTGIHSWAIHSLCVAVARLQPRVRRLSWLERSAYSVEVNQRATLAVDAMDDVVRAVVSGERRLVAFDVEATCWKKGVFSRKKETIEIGAVLLLLDRAQSGWPEFQTFVRPRRLPRLSSFCRELTGITQENVDAAPGFPEALRLFLEWAQPLERVVLATWSRYDLWQLDLDLETHGLPKLAIPFLDVKKLAAHVVGAKSLEETARELAPGAVAMPSHRAIADARRTALILDRLLRPPA
jgi:inhibitor of KinA sporulation pathway (predicted exonuclease)